MTEKPFCCRCKDDFRTADKEDWQMGALRKLKHAPKWMRNKYASWVDSELHGEGYLCGNCYFDLLDEKEERK